MHRIEEKQGKPVRRAPFGMASRVRPPPAVVGTDGGASHFRAMPVDVLCKEKQKARRAADLGWDTKALPHCQRKNLIFATFVSFC